MGLRGRPAGARRLLRAAWAEITRDNLPTRIAKCVVATTICVIIMLIPGISKHYGKAGYLACICSVFAHPGLRLGGAVEPLAMVLIGTVVGTSWSTFGVYLSSLVYPANPDGAMTIKAMFLIIASFMHGYIRASTPRLFLMVLFAIIPVLIGLAYPTIQVTEMSVVLLLYPTLTAIATVFVVNLVVLPEFGSTELAVGIIDVLHQAQRLQEIAVARFLCGNTTTVEELKSAREKLEGKVAANKSVYRECCFELAFSVLAPWELRPIGRKGVKYLVRHTSQMVADCASTQSTELAPGPHLLKKLIGPLSRLSAATSRAIDVVAASVAFTYAASPSPGHQSPSGIPSKELEIHIEILTSAITTFEEETSSIAGTLETDDKPARRRRHLIINFIDSLRNTAETTLEMLKASQTLIDNHSARNGRRRFHRPRGRWAKWLFTSQTPELDELRISRTVSAVETPGRHWWWRPKTRPTAPPPSISTVWRWATHSSSFIYATNFTLGVVLLTFPAFHPAWNHWYHVSRGVWAPLIFVLVFENEVQSTLWIFWLRTCGTVLGSTWGYAAYEARNGNEFVIAVMIAIGLVPGYWVQLGTRWRQAGMVASISMCVVALSTHLQTVEGSSRANFTKRVATMVVGGCVATAVALFADGVGWVRRWIKGRKLNEKEWGGEEV